MKTLDWKRIWRLTAAVFLLFHAVFSNVVFAQSGGFSDSAIKSSETQIVDEGKCGKDVYWSLDDNGKLVISGSGEMSLSFGNLHEDESGVSLYAPWEFKREEIKSIVVEKGVTNIGDFAFYGCSNLSSVELMEGVTSIGKRAFLKCSNLRSIELMEGVTSIGKRAFLKCSNLRSIELPKRLMNIEEQVFSKCYSLVSIELPEGLTSIGKEAFFNCSSLASIELPEGLTSIGEEAFSDCYSLAGIEIPSTVMSIGGGAFFNCSSLVNIELPEGLTNIRSTTFYNCSNLAGIEIPSTVMSIGDATFSYCDNLASIELPEGLTSIGERTFKCCSSLTSIELPKGLTSIERGLFSECNGLTSIEIPFAVTSIGEEAFYDCSNLISSIEIPPGVTSIGDDAFSGCSGLASIEIPSSVTSIGDDAFYGCGNLNYIKVEKENTVYDSRNNCNAIVETKSNTLMRGSLNTEIPSDVTSISDGAFSGCSGLASIEIPSSVTSIGNHAFYGCGNLKNIKVEKENTVYDSRNNCNAIIETKSNTLILGSLNTVIPSGVTSIGDYAFFGCSGLTSIEIPSSVRSIGFKSFSKCSSLASIKLFEGITAIDQWGFWKCSSLTSIEIPSSLRKIGYGVFEGCSSLTSIEILSSMTEIEDGAFLGCSNLTIYGDKDSYAQEYAANNNIPFSLLSSLVKVEKITLNPTQVTLKVGGTIYLEVAITPDNVQNKQLKWDTDHTEIATVENGLVTAISEGTATITATSQDGSNISASCKVTVQKAGSDQKEKEEQSLTGTSSYSKTYGDAPFKLDVALEKGNGILFYASSNPKVAEVSDKGEVKITGAGKTSITVTASETEEYKKCEYQVSINVAKAEQRISGVSNYNKVAGNKPFCLDVKRIQGDGKLSYLSSNLMVATVSDSGMATIKKPGNTVITVTAAGTANYNACTFCINLSVTAPKKGATLTDSRTKVKYKVTKQGKSVEYSKPKDKKATKVTVPATVTISGVKYNVTGIAANAFSGCKKLKSVSIGKNVESISTKAFANCTALGKVSIPSKVSQIGKQVFSGCGKLKDITIKSTKLTSKTVGAKAFQGIHAKAAIKVPKAKKAAYQKLLKSKGIGKKVTIK